jgi:hypothetical protein
VHGKKAEKHHSHPELRFTHLEQQGLEIKQAS